MIRNLKRMIFMILVLLGTVLPASAQDPSDRTERHAHDPTPNRLFVMSTGRLIEPGTAVIGIHELVVAKLDYAPSENIQISGVLNPFAGLLGAGAKMQLIEPAGLFQGLAAGGDLYIAAFSDNLPLAATVNVAASAGTEQAAIHVNALTAFGKGIADIRSALLMQVGAEIQVDAGNSHGMKLLAELDFPINDFTDKVWLVGMRTYGQVVSWEAALIVIPDLPFAPHPTSSSSGSLFVLPYLSITWAL
jgi:hypothetical protein